MSEVELIMLNIKEVLENAKTIAIVGLSEKSGRTSNRIGKYLQSVGKYRIIPVNPTVDEIFGERSYKSLLDIPLDIKVDIVNVFRRSEYLEDIAKEAMLRGCGALWAQLGVYDENAAHILEESKIPYVMNRCIFVEHQNIIY